MINTQHLRGSEIRQLPITADTRHQTFMTVQEMDFMYLLPLARYAVHVYMAICAPYHYICDRQSLRFQLLLEQWYFVNTTNLDI